MPAEQATQLIRFHAEAYARLADQVRPLPGAREVLDYLSQADVPWAIATSGLLESARPALDSLGIGTGAPLVTREQVPMPNPIPTCSLRRPDVWGPRLRGGGRQCVGPLSRPPGEGAGSGLAVRRLWPG